MNSVESIRKIKETTLVLSKKYRCEKISVSMVVEEAGIARSTFYKQFPNMPEVWHSFTHDIMDTISRQMDYLYVVPARIITEPKQSNIVNLAKQNPEVLADYFSRFFLQNQHILKCLIKENMDPLFLKKWKNLTCSIFQETLRLRGCDRQESFEISDILSTGLVHKCKDAVLSENGTALYGIYMATYKILFLIAEQKQQLQESAQFLKNAN